MLILHITSTDPAGAVFNWCRAINEHTKHTARLITTDRIEAFDFPRDICELYDTGEEIQALLEMADVVHFHKIDETMEISFLVRGQEKVIKPSEFVSGKKIVYQLHGHKDERHDPTTHAKKLYGNKPIERPILAVTPDLEAMYRPHLGERVQYFPNCVPVRDVRYMPRQIDTLHETKIDDKLVRQHMVIQTPTNTLLKNTEMIKRVVERLGKELPVFFWQVGPNPTVTQDTALRFMRQAHIVFDHVEGYYGLSSLQGLSMGKPTIAGISDYSRQRMAEFWRMDPLELPWIISQTEEAIEATIRFYLTDPAARRERGEESRRFMLDVWSDRAVAQRLAEFYEHL